MRWLRPDELDPAHPDAVDWLEPDRPFLTELAAVLRAMPAPTGLRAIVFEEDDAHAIEARLRADGYDAEVLRERLAGEDDDEDHPWAVVSDAPEVVLDLLVDTYDGWLDRDEAAQPPSRARRRSTCRPRRVASSAPEPHTAGGRRPLGSRHDRRLSRPRRPSACCSCTPTPTTSRSATAPRWPSTSTRVATSPW